jgi:DNA-binding transcriptional ArsR family regulator
MMNITPQTNTLSVANLFQILGVQPRLEILLAIGENEACVCHLEAALGYRQAFISQHLMALREANILTSRRDGRFIFYRLADRRILDVLTQAGELLGNPVTLLPLKLFSCECPNCNAKA